MVAHTAVTRARQVGPCAACGAAIRGRADMRAMVCDHSHPLPRRSNHRLPPSCVHCTVHHPTRTAPAARRRQNSSVPPHRHEQRRTPPPAAAARRLHAPPRRCASSVKRLISRVPPDDAWPPNAGRLTMASAGIYGLPIRRGLLRWPLQVGPMEGVPWRGVLRRGSHGGGPVEGPRQMATSAVALEGGGGDAAGLGLLWGVRRLGGRSSIVGQSLVEHDAEAERREHRRHHQRPYRHREGLR